MNPLEFKREKSGRRFNALIEVGASGLAIVTTTAFAHALDWMDSFSGKDQIASDLSQNIDFTTEYLGQPEPNNVVNALQAIILGIMLAGEYKRYNEKNQDANALYTHLSATAIIAAPHFLIHAVDIANDLMNERNVVLSLAKIGTVLFAGYSLVRSISSLNSDRTPKLSEVHGAGGIEQSEAKATKKIQNQLAVNQNISARTGISVKGIELIQKFGDTHLIENLLFIATTQFPTPQQQEDHQRYLVEETEKLAKFLDINVGKVALKLPAPKTEAESAPTIISLSKQQKKDILSGK